MKVLLKDKTNRINYWEKLVNSILRIDWLHLVDLFSTLIIQVYLLQIKRIKQFSLSKLMTTNLLFKPPLMSVHKYLVYCLFQNLFRMKLVKINLSQPLSQQKTLWKRSILSLVDLICSILQPNLSRNQFFHIHNYPRMRSFKSNFHLNCMITLKKLHPNLLLRQL